MHKGRRLEQRILVALTQALAEHQSEAAEHLLRALEALSEDAVPGSPLADAHLLLSVPPMKWPSGTS